MKVTQRAQIALVKANSVSHVVDVDDASQDPAGSSYKATETQRFNGRGLAVQNNLISAIAAPVVGSDSSLGYSKGSTWFFAGILYVCQDAAVGAAVWKSYSESLSGTWTPTETNLVDCTLVIFPFNYIRVGNVVNFGGFLRVDIEPGFTQCSFLLDLDALIQPNNNFASFTDITTVISRVNGILTDVCVLEAAGGAKLIVGQFASTVDGESIRVAVQGSFVTNN